ncbi:MAG: NADH-quinone oxidoreductase subunit J [Nitrospinota bacterium]|nr:NADH-quinone oxidoreductase subunit J [Nitrospinota bacterium]
MEMAVFIVAGGISVFLSVVMVLARKPVTSAMSLVGVMFCLAVLFAIQSAHLIAILQILVYAGAIMVLFLFVIMLLNLREKEGMESHTKGYAQMFGGAMAFVVLVAAVGLTSMPSSPAVLASDRFGTTAEVGRLLFTRYILPFEITSVLLLAALVGAVALVKIRMR